MKKILVLLFVLFGITGMAQAWTVGDGSSAVVRYYYLSSYENVDDAATHLNAKDEELTLVLDTDKTMDTSASFDVEVAVVGVPGCTITATGYTVTIKGLLIEYSDTFTGGTITRSGGVMRLQAAAPTIILNDTGGADGFIAVNAADAADSVVTMGVDDSGGDDQTYIEMDGTLERVEIKEALLAEKAVTLSLLFNLTPATQTFTTEADLTVTTGILLLDGDNDGEGDTLQLQDGTTAGQVLIIVTAADVDANDAVSIDHTTDTTCTGCPSVIFNSVGESAMFVWTGSTWALVSLADNE